MQFEIEIWYANSLKI